MTSKITSLEIRSTLPSLPAVPHPVTSIAKEKLLDAKPLEESKKLQEKKVQNQGFSGLKPGFLFACKESKPELKAPPQEVIKRGFLIAKKEAVPLPQKGAIEKTEAQELASTEKELADAFIKAMDQYFNKKSETRGLWYPGCYQEAHPSLMKDSYKEGFADETYFKRVAEFDFQMKDGVKPSDALLRFLEGLTIAECGNATIACGYKAILDVVGEEKFNAVFSLLGLRIGEGGITQPSCAISFFAEFVILPENLKGVIGKRPLRKGEECHFSGVSFYANKFPKGFAGGWNVIYVGDDSQGKQLFNAHGFSKPMTEEEIYQLLLDHYNKDRSPQDWKDAEARDPDLHDIKRNPYLIKFYKLPLDISSAMPFITGFQHKSIKRLNPRVILDLKRKEAKTFIFDWATHIIQNGVRKDIEVHLT